MAVLFSEESTNPCLAVWLEKYDHLYAGRGNLHTEDHSQNPPLNAHPVVSSWHLLRHESNWVWWHGYFLEYRWCTIHAITYYKIQNAKLVGDSVPHSPLVCTYFQLELDQLRSQNKSASICSNLVVSPVNHVIELDGPSNYPSPPILME